VDINKPLRPTKVPIHTQNKIRENEVFTSELNGGYDTTHFFYYQTTIPPKSG